VPLGRRAHRATTVGGEEVSLEEIESRLKVSPYIATAVALAADRPYVAALVELAPDSVADWARRRGLQVTTYASLAESGEVAALIEGEVRRANASLPPSAQVREVRILSRRLERELTPTGQVRRAVVEEEFAETIGELYERAAASAAADSES
jgi:long-chain acyl-CoA synthetase